MKFSIKGANETKISISNGEKKKKKKLDMYLTILLILYLKVRHTEALLVADSD